MPNTALELSMPCDREVIFHRRLIEEAELMDKVVVKDN